MSDQPRRAQAQTPEPEPPAEIRIVALRGVPEVHHGDDMAALVVAALVSSGLNAHDGDVLVATQKVISKAEGQLVELHGVEPSSLALDFAARWQKDPHYVELVLRESVRIVRMDRGIIISQTRHGFVCANAGVDASNVSGGDVACLLPADPDASAAALRSALFERTGADLAVIISDSFGRPWRNGIVNVAIGVAGLAPLADYRGQPDDFGRVMHASVLAVADELASAAELASGKVNRAPFVLIRGYAYARRDGQGAGAELIMDPAADLFR
jgi:coenzyme F420-0:L-glutamate ligase / coenzyme F420-1:gamma-L-glutamate ligase